MKKLLRATLSFAILSTVVLAQQPQNPGFENWEIADPDNDIEEPVHWSSIKTSDAGSTINGFAPVVWEKSDDAHTGNHSIELTNVQSLLLASGTITNGRIHASLIQGASNSYTDPNDAQWHTPLTTRPDSLAVWIKYFPQGNDTAQVKAVLHVGEGTLPSTPENEGNWVGYAQINVWETVSEWTRVVVPFTYYNQNNPEYVLFVLTSGAGLQPVEGSVALFDDLQLVYESNGLNDLNTDNSLVYTHGMTINLQKIPAEHLKGAHLELISMQGVRITSRAIGSKQINLAGQGISGGIYIVRIVGSEGVYAQKVQLR